MKALYSFFLVLVMLSCTAQENSTIIQYELPEKVTTKIAEYIDVTLKQDRTRLFAAQLSTEDVNRYFLSLAEYNEMDKNFKLIKETIIDKTNRMLKIGDLQIPVFLSLDLMFADFGKKTMPNGRVAKTKVLHISEGFSITFDRNGNIFSNN